MKLAESAIILLNNHFQNSFPIITDFPDSGLFRLIKIKAQQISFFHLIKFQLFKKLLLSTGIIFVSPPDFQFNYKAFSLIINDYLRAYAIPGSGLNIIFSRSIFTWF